MKSAKINVSVREFHHFHGLLRVTSKSVIHFQSAKNPTFILKVKVVQIFLFSSFSLHIKLLLLRSSLEISYYQHELTYNSKKFSTMIVAIKEWRKWEFYLSPYHSLHSKNRLWHVRQIFFSSNQPQYHSSFLETMENW